MSPSRKIHIQPEYKMPARNLFACLLLWSAFCFFPAGETRAQSIPVGDPFEFYSRVLRLSDTTYSGPSFNIRPVSRLKTHDSRLNNHPWHQHSFFTDTTRQRFNFHSPQFTTTWSSRMPFGQNDGAMWQGKGLNTHFSFGAYADYGPLKISLRPQAGYSQNLDFELSPYPTGEDITDFGTPFEKSIDHPQRFGEDPVSFIHPGESYVQLEHRGLAAGISTQNIWTGPAVQNPILFSNNAPGFFHGFIGTYRPVHTPIGDVEGRLLWGGLQESDFFDNNPDNNMRFINAIALNYSPAFIPGLHLGGVRMLMLTYPEEGLQVSDFARVAIPFTKDNFMTEENRSGQDDAYQMLSLFGRWVFAESGFETYFEWARNDHSRDSRDLNIHFTHARAYVLGIIKKIELSGSRWLIINAEQTNLEGERGGRPRRAGPYYQNATVRQGFTNLGQILGSAIGPGSNSRMIRLDYYDPRGLTGLSFNQIDYQVDRLERNIEMINNYQDSSKDPGELHETEHRFGLYGILFLPRNFQVQVNLYQSFFHNRYNLAGNTVRNLNASFVLRYEL